MKRYSYLIAGIVMLSLTGCDTCVESHVEVIHHPATTETTWVKSYWTGFPTAIKTPVAAWDESETVCDKWQSEVQAPSSL